MAHQLNTKKGDDVAITAIPTPQPKTFDDLLNLINPRGRWQLFTLLQCVASYIAVGISAYGQSIFVIGRMEATCVKYADNSTPTENYLQHTTTNNTRNFNSTSQQNFVIDAKWLEKYQCNSPTTNATLKSASSKCVQWSYSSPYYTSTMQSEWNFVCDNAYKVPLFQACYQLGYMFGMPIVGNIADFIGRRGVIWLAWPVLVTGYTVMSQAPYFWLASLMRILQGVVFGSYWNAKLILNMELTVPEKRNLISVLINCSWPVSAILISILAYYVRTWRMLQLICIAPAVAILPLILLLPESPRWLATRCKFERALRTLKKGAKINRRTENLRTVTDENTDISKVLLAMCDGDTSKIKAEELNFVAGGGRKQELTLSNISQCWRQINIKNPFRGFVCFMQEPTLRKSTLLLFVQWCSAALVFYGVMFYGTGVLPGSPHLKFGLMSVARLLASPLQLLIFNRFGAKHSLVVLSFLTAVSLLTVGLLPATVATQQPSATISFWSSLFPNGSVTVTNIVLIGILMLANCLIDACFAAVYIITGDVYPTHFRQTGFSLCSTMAGIGSAVSPFAADVFGLWWRPLPAFVFAGSCAVASILAFFLPSPSVITTGETDEDEATSVSTISTAVFNIVNSSKAVATHISASSKTKTTRRPAISRLSSVLSNTVVFSEAMCGGGVSMLASPDLAVGGNLPKPTNESLKKHDTTFKTQSWNDARSAVKKNDKNRAKLLQRFSTRQNRSIRQLLDFTSKRAKVNPASTSASPETIAATVSVQRAPSSSKVHHPMASRTKSTVSILSPSSLLTLPVVVEESLERRSSSFCSNTSSNNNCDNNDDHRPASASTTIDSSV